MREGIADGVGAEVWTRRHGIGLVLGLENWLGGGRVSA
jgi:hypothetical protein